VFFLRGDDDRDDGSMDFFPRRGIIIAFKAGIEMQKQMERLVRKLFGRYPEGV